MKLREKLIIIILVIGMSVLVYSRLWSDTVYAGSTADKPYIEVNVSKKTITAGKSVTFKAKVYNSTSAVKWSVSDKNIAAVTRKGKLTAKRAGKVTVYAKAGNLTGKIAVTVKGRKLIAVDPGHQSKGDSRLEPSGPGSNTKKARAAGGTTGKYTKVPEYKLTLTIALKVKEELWNRGYEVAMTREKNDVNISNKERAELANASGADICIRLHADGAASSSASGASALYPSAKNKYVSGLSKQSKALSKAVLDAYCSVTSAKNRGLSARDDLTGTNWSEIPVTVLEMGFMTNKQEDKKMQTSEYQDKMVQGICDGIEAYYNNK